MFAPLYFQLTILPPRPMVRRLNRTALLGLGRTLQRVNSASCPNRWSPNVILYLSSRSQLVCQIYAARTQRRQPLDGSKNNATLRGPYLVNEPPSDPFCDNTYIVKEGFGGSVGHASVPCLMSWATRRSEKLLCLQYNFGDRRFIASRHADFNWSRRQR